MKKLLSTFKVIFLTLQFLGLSMSVTAQNPFIIKYTIPENGFEKIVIPLKGDYGVQIGSTPSNPVGVSYASTGEFNYTLPAGLRADGGDIYFFISPRSNGDTHPFNRITFEGPSINVRNYITDIIQWGDIEWASFVWAFYDCRNLEITATDVPNLSNVKDMTYAFAHTRISNISNINNWDVSNVTSMIGIFYNAINFNQDISSWNVSNVINMDDMFKEAKNFNQDISSWDVSNVIRMDKMFYNAKNFNQNLGNWNLFSLTNAEDIFYNSGLDCENLSKTLMSWALNPNTPNLIGHAGEIEISNLEYSPDITIYKNLLNSKGWTISGAVEGACQIEDTPKSFYTIWDTEQTELTIPAVGQYAYQWYKDNDEVNSTVGYAKNAQIITLPNQGIYHIKMIPLKDESFAINFNNTGNKEDIIRISQWGDVKWSSFKGAFYGCENLRVAATDMPNIEMVKDMSYAFANSGVTNILNINEWNVSNVTNMHSMFANAKSFNTNISTWDVSNVKRMNNMFNQASSFNQDLSNWNISSLEPIGLNDVSFANSGMNCKNFSKIIHAWANLDNIPVGVEINAEGMELSYALTNVKTFLSNEYSWTFLGDIEGSCEIDLETSIENRDFELTVLPNPTQNHINITGLNGNELITIYDINGNILIKKNAKTSIEKMNLRRLASGIYFIKILTNNNEIVTHKILKE